MRELIENDADFRIFLKETLKDKYFPFEQSIRFIRNVLNHGTSSNLSIKLEDYEIQKDFSIICFFHQTMVIKRKYVNGRNTIGYLNNLV